MIGKTKISARLFILFSLIILAIILNGCSHYSIDSKITPSSMVTTLTPISETTEQTTDEIITGPNIQISDLLLDNGSCSFPCFIGIIPGESTIIEVTRLMEDIGATPFYEDDVEEGFHIENQINVSSTSSNLQILNHFFGENDTIKLITIGLYGTYTSLIHYYSIEQVLEREGEPSGIWIYVGISDESNLPSETAFNILLFYEEINTVIVYFGTALKNNDSYSVCPETPNINSTQEPTNHFAARFYFGNETYTNPNTLIAPTGWTIGEIDDDQGEYFSPLNLHTMETIESFYSGILAPGSDYCFSWNISPN